MQYDVKLILRAIPGAPERVLQVIRFRQFDLVRLSLQNISETELALECCVSGERPLSLLTSQLRKLSDLMELTTPVPATPTLLKSKNNAY